MTTATALVIPALRDVRDAQAKVADTFQAHYAVTPDGPHRPSLRQHADDAREHLRRLDEPLEDFQPRRPVLHPLNLARQATRVFLLPLEAAVGIPAAVIVPVLMLGILLALSRYEDKVFSARPARPRQTRRPGPGPDASAQHAASAGRPPESRATGSRLSRKGARARP
ncbi:hypothetical protein [Actinacidiphila oryziradicis]|uniref:Uncharacterized protein n=1 Tax=Actinacidiphila oryziradicis TaxID=2571141 RepID=A0A4U0SHB0_9ACTN|nr:hypothetical protein [Actinacidiphila oryziradicis]TJZ99634.1 hypothetical protein FCI23_45060 [Actinacidiphila oryziradicis]